MFGCCFRTLAVILSSFLKKKLFSWFLYFVFACVVLNTKSPSQTLGTKPHFHLKLEKSGESNRCLTLFTFVSWLDGNSSSHRVKKIYKYKKSGSLTIQLHYGKQTFNYCINNAKGICSVTKN